MSSSLLMHFSFLPTFHHRIIASADAQCYQPIGDNFSLPTTGCLIALLSLILLYLKHYLKKSGLPVDQWEKMASDRISGGN